MLDLPLQPFPPRDSNLVPLYRQAEVDLQPGVAVYLVQVCSPVVLVAKLPSEPNILYSEGWLDSVVHYWHAALPDLREHVRKVVLVEAECAP